MRTTGPQKDSTAPRFCPAASAAARKIAQVRWATLSAIRPVPMRAQRTVRKMSGEDEAHDEHARCLFEDGQDQASHRSRLRRWLGSRDASLLGR